MEEHGRVSDSKVDKYAVLLSEHYRPPSKGGNKTALHSHAIFIGDRKYTFLARGARKWVFASDTVTFDWVLSQDKYFNIVKETIVTKDAAGNLVERGNRSFKPKLRTAPTRLPVSRREAR